MNTEQIAKNYILTKNTDQEFVPQLLLSFKLDNSDSIFDTSTFVTLLFPKYIEEKQFVQEDLLELITENLYYYNEYDDETLLVFENIEVHMLKISAKTWIKNQKYLKLCILINIILDTPVVNRIKNKIISQKLQFALEHEIPIPEVLYALVVVNNKIQYAYHDNLLIALYNYQKFNYNQDYQPKQIDQLMIQSILLLQRHYDQLEEIIQIIVKDQESIFNQNLKSIDISDTISFLLLTAIEMMGESQKIKIISKNVNHNDCTLAKEEIDHNIEIKCKILLAVAVEKLVLFIELLSRIKIDKNEILLYKCPNLIVSLHKIPQLKTTISTLKQNFSLIDSEFDKYKYIPLSVIVEKMFLLILDNCTKYREKIEYHLQKPQFKCFHQYILLSDNPNFQGIKDVIRDLMGFIIITSKTLKSNYYVSQQEQIRQAVLQILQFYCENQIVFLEIFRFITSELKLNNFETLIQCLDVHPGMWEFSKTSSFSTNNCTQQQLLTAQKYCLVNFVYINTIMEISKQSESGIIVRMVSLIYTKRYQYHDDLKLILQEDGIKENLFKIEEKYSLSFHEKIRKLMSFY